MRNFAFVLLGAVTVVIAQNSQGQYTSKWDSIDTKSIIDNQRLFSKYKACILGDTTTGCPQEALYLKSE
ncbi:uncharacterized protein LOC105695896 [Orussus abietinus]|uniref:uncharacterized protein LOC105695896 n=1 Tax=Orussus abietinus TaxID=222816 RepID=UPI000C715CEC|nr:uncharacterized protein LOC105695896 [Orussus abietinus]